MQSNQFRTRISLFCDQTTIEMFPSVLPPEVGDFLLKNSRFSPGNFNWELWKFNHTLKKSFNCNKSWNITRAIYECLVQVDVTDWFWGKKEIHLKVKRVQFRRAWSLSADRWFIYVLHFYCRCRKRQLQLQRILFIFNHDSVPVAL